VIGSPIGLDRRTIIAEIGEKRIVDTYDQFALRG
jgi:hypothetical protein